MSGADAKSWSAYHNAGGRKRERSHSTQTFALQMCPFACSKSVSREFTFDARRMPHRVLGDEERMAGHGHAQPLLGAPFGAQLEPAAGTLTDACDDSGALNDLAEVES